MKPSIRSVALAFLLGLSLGSPVAAAQLAQAAQPAVDIYARFREEPRTETEQLANGLWRTRLPLAALRAEPGAMRLTGAKASEQISFEIAPQADIQSASLVLRHVSGRAQEGSRPQLRLGLNGRFIAQIDGVTERAAGINEVVLDPSSLRAGYNALSIDAVQRYTDGCQDPDAAELWTDVDTARSFVEIIYARSPYAGSLADLGAVISAGVGGVQTLGIIVGEGPLTSAELRWGTLAAQGVVNRMSFGVPQIERLDPASLRSIGKGIDIVAVGTPEQLAGFAPAGLARISEDQSWLSIGPSPADSSRFLIIVSGRTPEAIDGALRALNAHGLPLSDSTSIVLDPAEVPQGANLVRHPALRDGAKYTFGDLGMRDTSVLGRESGSATVSFSLAPDLHFREKGQVEFALDFAYGAGLDDKSVVNVLVNGAFHRSIRLTNPDGEVTPGYRLTIPATEFSPGRNEVVFDVQMSTPAEGACAARNTRHFAFILKDTSTLTLPEADHFVELPNLALMSEAGFPYTGLQPETFAVRAASPDSETAAAVWTVAAKLAQLNGTSFFDADFGFGVDLPDSHTLVVGARPDLNGFLPAEIDMPGAQSGGFNQDFTLMDLGENGLLISGESPSHPGRLVTLVTAETGGQLLASTTSLVTPGHWTQLNGAAMVWRDNAATIVTREASQLFEVGTLSPGDIARLKSGRAPWRWILTLAAVLFALAAALALIARYMRDRTTEK